MATEPKSSEVLTGHSIISVKEARKLLGKKASSQLSDEEIGRLIGNMTFLANRLLEVKLVPQNGKVL